MNLMSLTGTAVNVADFYGDLSTYDFNAVLDGVIGVIPYAIPAVLLYIGFRKGWNFLMGVLRRA